VDAQRGVQGQGPDRLGQAAVGEYRRVDAADQFPQFPQRLGGVIPRLDQQRPGRLGIVVDQLPGGV